MDWLFGSKKDEKPKDEFDKIQIKVGKIGTLPPLKPLEISEGFKLPEKPKIKSKRDIKVEKEVALGKAAFDIQD